MFRRFLQIFKKKEVCDYREKRIIARKHCTWVDARLTPVAGDGAGEQTGDVVGETRPAPEHNG